MRNFRISRPGPLARGLAGTAMAVLRPASEVALPDTGRDLRAPTAASGLIPALERCTDFAHNLKADFEKWKCHEMS